MLALYHFDDLLNAMILYSASTDSACSSRTFAVSQLHHGDMAI